MSCPFGIMLVVAFCGCSQSALVGRIDGLPADAAILDEFDAAGLDGAPGFVDGRLHAHAEFNSVGAVYWFGGNDDRSHLNLWIYRNAPTCAELSSPGWIPRVRPTDLMRITVGGTKPATYPVVATDPPAPGSAYVLHVIDQSDPIIESEALSGAVVIDRVEPGVNVLGVFTGTFSTGSLQGEFIATWCPTGVSP